MSVIKEALMQLQTSAHPIARFLHIGTDFKVLILDFKSGMQLKDHKAHIPSILTVFSCVVIYREGNKEITLHQYDEYNIPVEASHSVEALEDAICLLSQG